MFRILIIMTSVAVILGMDPNSPNTRSTLNANAPEFIPKSLASLQQRQSQLPGQGHRDELFGFDQNDWWEDASPKAEEKEDQRREASSSSFSSYAFTHQTGRSADNVDKNPIRDVQNIDVLESPMSEVKNADEVKKDAEKTSSSPEIVYKKSPLGAGVSEQVKEDKNIPKDVDKNEAELATDHPKKIPFLKEQGTQSLQSKISTEEKGQKSEGSTITFGSFTSPIVSGFVGIGKLGTPAKTNQKDNEPFVQELEPRKALQNVEQKKMEHPSLGVQSSSSSAKSGRESMMSTGPGTKHVSASGSEGQQAADQKEQPGHQRDPLPLVRKSILPRGKYEIPAKQRGGHAHVVAKKNSPSSSPAGSSLVASSPLSAASSVPTSPSIASLHSTSPIGSIKPMESASKLQENKFDLLEEHEEERSPKTEARKDLRDEGSGRSEIHQQEGTAKGKLEKTESASGKGATAARASKGGKAKVKSQRQIDHEDRREMEKAIKERMKLEQSSRLVTKQEDPATVQQSDSEQSMSPVKKPMISGDKQKGVASSESHIDEEKSLQTASLEEEERQELNAAVNVIVSQFYHLQKLYKSTDPSGKEHKLSELNSNYLGVMKSLDNFVLKFGEKYGKSPSTNYFYDVLLWISQICPLMNAKQLDRFQEIVRNCLLYLDKNGGMNHLNEQGEQMNILDELFQNISKLDGLIVKYKECEKVKDDKGRTEKANALREVEDWFKQYVDNNLIYEVIGYLYVGVKKSKPGEREEVGNSGIGLASLYLTKFTFVLPKRREQITAAIDSICKLMGFPLFQQSDGPPSSEPPICGISGDKQKGVVSSGSHVDEGKSPIATSLVEEEEREELKIAIDGIVSKIYHLQKLQRGTADPSESGHKLRELKSNYLALMKMLENFVLKYGEKNRKPPTSYIYFGDILERISQIYSAIDETELNDLQQIVRECLAYLDVNGCLTHLNEQGEQLNILDELFRNIATLDTLITAHEKMEDIADADSTKVVKEMNAFYKQNVDIQLHEVFSYLYIVVTGKEKSNLSTGQINIGFLELETTLFHRNYQITAANRTLNKFHDLVIKEAKSLIKQLMSGMSGDKQKGVSSSGSHIDEAQSPKAASIGEQEQKEIKAPISGIISQIHHLRTLLESCNLVTTPLGKQHELQELKSNYLELMKRLENFLLKHGEKYGNPPSSYIGDILLWIGQINPAIDGEELNELQQILRDSLVCLDDNGGMTQLTEQGEQQLNIFDELFKNLTTLDGLINEYNDTKNSKNDIGGRKKAIALENLDDYYELHVKDKLYEAIGYLFVRVRRDPREIGHAGTCLIKIATVLPNREKQIKTAMITICKLFILPKFQTYESSSPSDTIEITIPSSEVSQYIKPCVAEGSGSSSAQINPTNIATLDKSDSSDSASHNVAKTPEESVKTTNSPLRNQIDLILMKIGVLKSINNNYMNPKGPTFVKQSKLEQLGPTYKEVMDMLENFTIIYGAKWNGNVYFDAILKWIGTTFKMREWPKDLKSIMHKSLVLMDQHEMTNFEKLFKDIMELNTMLAEYHSIMHEKHGIADEKSQMLFKEMETFYMEKVEPELREALSFQFIGMRKKIVPPYENVERIRKRIANAGLLSLIIAMKEQGMAKRVDQFKMVQETLKLFFETWTAGLEILIRADLSGYVAKILGLNEKNAKVEWKKGKAKKAKKETAKNLLTLELIADKCVKIDARLQRNHEMTLYGSKLQIGLDVINELLRSSWEPSKKSLDSSCSSGKKDKKGKNIGKGKAKAEREEMEKTEAIEEEELINSFNWRSVLENARKLIRYIRLLSMMQDVERNVNKKVDGLHVHVRVWAILFDENISRTVEEWSKHLKSKKHPNGQGGDDGSMKEVLEFLALEISKFLAQNGQKDKGRHIKVALETLVFIDKLHAMRHRNKHLRRLLANSANQKVNPSKNVDDPSKVGDKPYKDGDDEYFKTCNCQQFDDLLQD